MNKIQKAAVGIGAAAVMLGSLFALLPIEKKQRELERFGSLAAAAETDERARYIIDNIDQYSDELVDLYNQSSEKNKEKNLDFIYNYAFHKNDYDSMSFTEEELNSKTIPALYMSDHRWAYERIGGTYIKSNGCAAVALTMAALYLNKDGEIDPKKAADRAEELDAINIFGGMNSLDIKNVIESFGLKCSEYNYDPDLGGTGNPDIAMIREILDKDHVLMAGMVGDTFGGHAIIIRECSEEGVIRINDPADEEKTEKEWNFDDICPEIYYLWEISK